MILWHQWAGLTTISRNGEPFLWRETQSGRTIYTKHTSNAVWNPLPKDLPGQGTGSLPNVLKDSPRRRQWHCSFLSNLWPQLDKQIHWSSLQCWSPQPRDTLHTHSNWSQTERTMYTFSRRSSEYVIRGRSGQDVPQPFHGLEGSSITTGNTDKQGPTCAAWILCCLKSRKLSTSISPFTPLLVEVINWRFLRIKFPNPFRIKNFTS